MEQLNTVDTIKTADLSVPIAANYQANGDLFGHRKSVTAANTIAVVADALRWQYEAFPDIPEVNATSNITVTSSSGGVFINYVNIYVDDPILGIVMIGQSPSIGDDFSANDIADALWSGISTSSNNYGYDAGLQPSGVNTFTVTAPSGRGSSMNGISIYFEISNGSFDYIITPFLGGVNGYINTSIRGVDNYLIWLCGKFGLDAQYVIGSVSGGGSVIPIYPTPIPNPIDFTVLMSGSFMVDGQSTVVIPSFLNYNIIFVRGGIIQPVVDLGSTYYNWSKATGTFTCYPAAVEGEIFQIIPATQIPTI